MLFSLFWHRTIPNNIDQKKEQAHAAWPQTPAINGSNRGSHGPERKENRQSKTQASPQNGNNTSPPHNWGQKRRVTKPRTQKGKSPKHKTSVTYLAYLAKRGHCTEVPNESTIVDRQRPATQPPQSLKHTQQQARPTVSPPTPIDVTSIASGKCCILCRETWVASPMLLKEHL